MKYLIFSDWSAAFSVFMLLWVIYSTASSSEGDACRVLGFYPPLSGKRLENHLIHNKQANSEDFCQALCYMNNNCRSINFNHTKDSDGTHLCELNDADEEQHPEDLKNRHEFSYRATKTPCASNPCRGNKTCQTGFGREGYRCVCLAGYQGKACEQVMTSCQRLHEIGLTEDGVYTIRPDEHGPLQVYCDQTTDGGGWAVLQRRVSPFNTNFKRNWEKYRTGFGNLTGEFWLGNDNIHRLTATPVSFRVDLHEKAGGNKRYAQYENFTVAGADDKYRWRMDSHSGDLPNAIYGSTWRWFREKGMQFSAPDNDNDNCPHCNCASGQFSGWWFNICGLVNLNWNHGPKWAMSFRNPYEWLWASFSEMKVRP